MHCFFIESIINASLILLAVLKQEQSESDQAKTQPWPFGLYIISFHVNEVKQHQNLIQHMAKLV